jgi:hypothetical protein
VASPEQRAVLWPKLRDEKTNPGVVFIEKITAKDRKTLRDFYRRAVSELVSIKEAEKVYQNMVEGQGDSLTFQYPVYRSLHPAIQWRVIQKMLRTICGEEKEDLEISQTFKRLKQPPASFVLEFPLGIFAVAWE